jgi:hypothetical protein
MMRSTAKLWLCIAITALALGAAACGGDNNATPPILAFEPIGTWVEDDSNWVVNAYRVRAGTVRSGVVHIPRYYRPDEDSPYLPVTQIGAAKDIGYRPSGGRNGAFEGTSITEINFLAPSNITNIGSRAFSRCAGLTNVIIPDSVTSIGDWAFLFCIGVTSVTIPDSVRNIGEGAFAACTGLTNVTVLAEVPPTLRHSNFMNTHTHANLQIFVPAGSVDAYKTAANWSALASRIVAIP